MHCIERINGRRVMVSPLAVAAPVAHDKLHIEKPALHLTPSILNAVNRLRTECHRRQAGHAGEAFLSPGIHGIGAPVVNAQIDASEAGHGIDDG